jgi:transcriptional regulator with XRE-family HTH domain
MQALISPTTVPFQNTRYDALMARTFSKQRPEQGARMAAFRRAAGLTQTELAKLVGEPQQNIAFWEQSDKPPRSDALPRLAKVLGVTVEQLVSGNAVSIKRSGPVGRAQKIFEEVSNLPRRQQDKLLDVISAYVEQVRRKAS